MRPPIAALCALVALVALPSSCAGCSEECRDTKQGSEGCPCSSDQDCTTRLGEVLLCQEGSCAPGDPPDAPAAACEADDDCGDGQACGLGLCSPAPDCQRIDATALRARARAGATLNPIQAATLSRDGCAHSADVADGALTFTFEQIDPRTGDLTIAGSCTAGAWAAAARAGVFTCGASTVILAVEDPCFTDVATSCAGTCVALGTDFSPTAGVCR